MIWLGVIMTLFAGIAGLYYRPRWGEGAKLCLLCAFMGLAAFPAGEGNAFFLVLESALSLFVALCCLFRLHREKLLRRRGQRRAKQQPQRGGEARPAEWGPERAGGARLRLTA